MSYELLIPQSDKIVLPKSEAMSIFEEEGETQLESLPAISIIHAAQLFKLPNDMTQKELPAILLDVHRANAYWAIPYEESGGNERPDCSSSNGIHPDNPNDAPAEECSMCPHNQFGSDFKGGKGKACKNIYRLTLLIGMPLPCVLVVPPTSLKAVSDYLQKLQFSGQPYQAGISVLSLEKKDSYSKLVISLKNTISDLDKLRGLANLRKNLLPIIRRKINFNQTELEGNGNGNGNNETADVGSAV